MEKEDKSYLDKNCNIIKKLIIEKVIPSLLRLTLCLKWIINII